MSHGSAKHIDVVAPRSKFYQGPFGRLCSDLPPWQPPGGTPEEIDRHLMDLANEMIELPGRTPTEIAGDPQLIDEIENGLNLKSNIPAGYVYFGQFVDHDITFDPASDLMRKNDPSGLLNHRTPRLDLDNIYGRGPDESPFLYDQQTRTRAGKVAFLLTGRAKQKNDQGVFVDTDLPELPRNAQGTALIGDKRNDENAIVSQLQTAFLRAHNELVRRADDAGVADPFEAARQTLRWLYQHIVWNDFMKRIAVDAVVDSALQLKETPDGRKVWKLGLGDVYDWKNAPYIPVEFSVAAYRFGHSMVRGEYQTNSDVRGFQDENGVRLFAPIFHVGGPADPDDPSGRPDDLRGFRSMLTKNIVQWDWFLKMQSSVAPLFPQMARKIDTKLSNALAALHEGPEGSVMNILAFRNLKRGVSFDLPSGTDTARKFGLKPINIPPERDALWFYILEEAQRGGGNQLGRLGSIIVCATFAGLLLGDPNSYLNRFPEWTPANDPLLRKGEDNVDSKDDAWELASIIRLGGMPVQGGDINNFPAEGAPVA